MSPSATLASLKFSADVLKFTQFLSDFHGLFGRNPGQKSASNREVKHDVYGKRQTAKIELLLSDFSRLYNLGKLFAFTVIKGFFSYFSTGFI